MYPQIKNFIGLRVGIKYARDAAQHIFLITEGHTGLVGRVRLIDIGIAIIDHTHPAARV